ncbi:MAG: lysylphosphatidylglycerol synthase domain-containing protein [Flavihumibacter sp.]
MPALAEAALMGYVVSTLFLVISPFLKGLGAVELSLAYILSRYGYSSVTALEITILYRLFEFWLPLLAGLIAWAWKGKNLFLRILPPTLIFLLGAVIYFRYSPRPSPPGCACCVNTCRANRSMHPTGPLY